MGNAALILPRSMLTQLLLASGSTCHVDAATGAGASRASGAKVARGVLNEAVISQRGGWRHGGDDGGR